MLTIEHNRCAAYSHYLTTSTSGYFIIPTLVTPLTTMEWASPLGNSGDVPSPRHGHTLTRMLGLPTLLLYGGQTEDNQLVNDMYTYNISTGTWKRITYAKSNEIPSARAQHTTTAISSSCVVVLGGNTLDPPQVANLETYLFDLRTNTWTNLAALDDENSEYPRMRSGHSTVWGRVDGHVTALYIFGGFGIDILDTVHRLRVTDWKWETVPVGPPHTDDNDKHGGTDSLATAPCFRESHSAIWLTGSPTMTGMLIAGGASDDVVHDDVWLLSPPAGGAGVNSDGTMQPTVRRGSTWTWRRLPIGVGCAFAHNAVGRHANASCILLPTSTPTLLLWGGRGGSSGQADLTNGEATKKSNLRSDSHAHLIDLKLRKSARVNIANMVATAGCSRISHAFARVGRTIYVCGGTDSEGAFLRCNMRALKLNENLVTTRTAAGDFGPPVKGAFGRNGVQSNGYCAGDNEGNDEDREDAHNVSSVHHDGIGDIDASNVPSMIPTGTKFLGRVIAASDCGAHVSVVIDGRVHKGILIAYPTKEDAGVMKSDDVLHTEPASIEHGANGVEAGIDERGDNAPLDTMVDAEEERTAEALQVQRMRDEALRVERQAKRRRFDEMVDALPDEPAIKTRVPDVGSDEVITLD